MIEYTSVYSVINEPMHFIEFIAVSIIILFYAFFCYKNRHLRNSNIIIKNHFKPSSILFFTTIGFVFFITTIPDIYDYRHTMDTFKKGKYKTVEGVVSQLDPMPYGGKKHESFVVNNMKFSYSDYNLIYGFHNAGSHGGPIKRNDMKVRISFITKIRNNERDNVILKLEIDKNQLWNQR